MFEQFIDLLFPKSCIYCGVYENLYICTNCKSKLIQYKPENFLTRKISKNWEINNDQKLSTNFEKVYYFYIYNDIIHELIKCIKYKFHTNKINTFIELLIEAKEFNKINFNEFDLITYIPISKERLRWREFNHTEIIVDKLAKKFNKPYCQILIKKIDTKSQIDLDREERLNNLKNSFEIKQKLPINLANQKILLVDDICTTGSTLLECSKTIKNQFPNVSIYGLCLARGENDNNNETENFLRYLI